MSEYTPIFDKGPFTTTTSAIVAGGTLLEVSGSGTAATAAANSLKVVGVAAFDAASGVQMTVHRFGIQELIASGGITAGDELVAATGGKVSTLAAVTTPTAADVTNTRAIVGVALTTATDTNKVQVFLKL